MLRNVIAFLAFLCTVVTIWVGVLFVDTINREERASHIEVASRNLLIALLDAETGQRGYLLTGDQSYLEPFRTGSRVLITRINELNSAIADAGSLPGNIQVLPELTQNKLAELQQTISLKEDHPEQALRIVKSNAGKTFMDAIRVNIDTLESWADNTHAEIQRRSLLLARTECGLFMFLAILVFIGLGLGPAPK